MPCCVATVLFRLNTQLPWSSEVVDSITMLLPPAPDNGGSLVVCSSLDSQRVLFTGERGKLLDSGGGVTLLLRLEYAIGCACSRYCADC